MLRLGTPSPSKNRGKIEYAGMVELVDTQDLGAVTSVTDYLSGYSDHPQLPLMDKKS